MMHQDVHGKLDGARFGFADVVGIVIAAVQVLRRRIVVRIIFTVVGVRRCRSPCTRRSHIIFRCVRVRLVQTNTNSPSAVKRAVPDERTSLSSRTNAISSRCADSDTEDERSDPSSAAS